MGPSDGAADKRGWHLIAGLDDDVIVAPMTGQGRAAVTVLRFSGPEGGIRQVFSAMGVEPLPRARRATLRHLSDADENPATSWLDEAILTVFEGPASYTGEWVVEVGLHGNPHLVDRVLRVAVRAGARHARPGEFSRRACAHGRMGLCEAEAIDALIRAEGDEGLRFARRLLDGALVERVRRSREALLRATAAVEALVDFPDDVEPTEAIGILDAVPSVAAELRSLLRSAEGSRQRLAGLQAVLRGPVNAGKSTLFNHLLGERRALVHATPGTTRDVVTATLLVGGFAVHLHDTAGERADVEEVELLGIERGRRLAEGADLVLEVRDGRELAGAPPQGSVGVATHADLVEEGRLRELRALGWVPSGPADPPEALLRRIEDHARAGSADALLHTGRQVDAVGACVDALDEAVAWGPAEPVLCGVALRRAGRFLAELAGEFDDEAVLDALFSTFCIGK